MPRNEIDDDIRADQVFDIGQVRPFETHIGLGLLGRFLSSLQKSIELG